MKKIFTLLSLCALLAGTASPASAASIDTQNYRRAFALLDAGHPEQAYFFASRGHDAALNRVLRGAYMAQPGNDFSFNDMASFIAQEPDWPNLRGIIAVAEQKIPPQTPYQEVVDWFVAHPPVTLAGFYRYVDAENALGLADTVTEQVRIRWIEGDFGADDLGAFYSRFSMLLNRNHHWARLDRLLWKNDPTNARRMYPYVDEGMKAVAETRLALAGQSRNMQRMLDRVPEGWRDTPGLLYERLRAYRKNNQDSAAISILQRAPKELGNNEAWWDERQIMIRRLMERHDFALAYHLAVNNSQTNPKKIAQAEFLAGWLALRFLNEPEDARDHFQALFDNSSTPISRARGAYWLARTDEVLGDTSAAQQEYETAANFNMTYYGQLAAARIYEKPLAHATPEPAIPTPVRQKFYDRDTVEAVEHLAALGERDRARIFFRAALEATGQRAEFALLTELAYHIDRPDLAIETAKAANQKNFLLTAGGYPLLDRRLPQPPESAFTHALIRQESMFNPDAESSVGAKGLMQLMPATAKSVAKSLGIRFKAQRLTEPDYNLKLGTAFVQDQINDFNGSYILALAGYNAGPHRVREWMAEIGDPRRPEVDPVDWIEQIPVQETRNYVQRIIENLQIYRARLNGGEAPLLILKDLRR